MSAVTSAAAKEAKRPIEPPVARSYRSWCSCISWHATRR
jgi:hypothetical protein